MDFKLNDLTSGLLWTSQAHRLSLVDFPDGLELVAQFFQNVRNTTSIQSSTSSFCPPPRTFSRPSASRFGRSPCWWDFSGLTLRRVAKFSGGARRNNFRRSSPRAFCPSPRAFLSHVTSRSGRSTCLWEFSRIALGRPALQGHVDDNFRGRRTLSPHESPESPAFPAPRAQPLGVCTCFGRPGLLRSRHHGGQESRQREPLALRIATS